MAMQETSSGVEPDAANKELLQRLRRDLDRQIAAYVYERPEGAVGSPLSAETISNYLDSMRRCLVEPRWEEANICTPQEALTGTGTKRMCVTMAEEESYVLVFDRYVRSTTWRGEAPMALAHGVSEDLGWIASSHDSWCLTV